MIKEEIKEVIKSGINRGYRQNILLLSSYNDFFNDIREYLLTVNLAQELLKWNSSHQFKIRIEYSVKDFYLNAFKAFEFDSTDPMDTKYNFRNAEHSPTDSLNQKVDIVLVEERTEDLASRQERVISGIEIKGINKSPKLIIEDAKRMASAMARIDPISENSIEYCYCVFISRLDKDDEIETRSSIRDKITSNKDKWNKKCKDLKKIYRSLNFKYEVFDIMEVPMEEIIDLHKQLESDYTEIANETGSIIGGIIEISRLTQI